MDRRVDLFNILQAEGKLSKITVYVSTETKSDPYEKNTEKAFLNPITIKAYVSQISFEALRWKYTGQVPSGSIQILCERKWENLLKLADKIEVNENSYKCWKDDDKNFMIMKRENYLVVILGRAND